MLFVKTDDLKPGMRIAKPIYNRMGVMLYERDTKLTEQGINSIKNFGLIGIYILEPAEPVPPLTQEELDFEQFQTIAVFQIRDDLIFLKNDKPPKNLLILVRDILKRYGSMDHKLSFTQNLRSSSDCIYKRAINCAILSALISHEMHLNYSDQAAVVAAALLYDFGLLFLPLALLEKEGAYTEEEEQEIAAARRKGFSLLHMEDNPYQIPKATFSILSSLLKMPSSPESVTKAIHASISTKILLVAETFDRLTAMQLNQEPVSELRAMQYLKKYPKCYDPAIVNALSRSIHILPVGACVDLSNGKKGLVVAENSLLFLCPLILLFDDNELLDLSQPEIAREVQIVDIMKTMDNRIAIDRVSLDLFQSDAHTKKIAEHFFKNHAHPAVSPISEPVEETTNFSEE
ncbi:MAG: HD domain-containing phosphohydrolase [Lachnospiraceae bacterium]